MPPPPDLSAPPDLRSPFELIDEVEKAIEVLILSYTADLSFFERFALSHARALGARVAVISDARMVIDDPVLVRQAGRTYLPGRASCLGAAAFHPKLVVIAGEGEVRVAIGSGNLTLAGWHANAELWTVLRGDADRAPAAVGAVSDFLAALADSAIRFGDGSQTALRRVAAILRDEFPATAPGPRLVHNLERPILDQLPVGPVDEVLVASPFYDAGLGALSALRERLRPGRIEICVEPETSVDGALLESFAAEHGAAIRWIASERYHHGKLVEWRRDGTVGVLTGSPNVSGQALTMTVADGGNCEIGLVDEDASPCPPPLGDSPAGGAPPLTHRSDQRPEGKLPIPLGAVAAGDRVTLSLDRALEQPARVQRYDLGTDGWRTAADFPAGAAELIMPRAAAPPGSALRLLLGDGTPTPRVFVTDLRRVAQPVPAAVGRARKAIAQVVAEGLEEVLLKDIEELRPHLLRTGTLIAAPVTEEGADGASGTEEVDRARPAPGLTLDDLLDAAEPILGRPTTQFALALPQIPGLWIDENVELDTDVEEMEGEPDGEEDERDEDGDGLDDGGEQQPEKLTEILEAASAAQRRRFRRFVQTLVAAGPSMPMLVRTLALRALLHGIRCGVWDAEEAPKILLAAIEAVAAPGDEPTEPERAAADCLLAFALVYLRHDAGKLSERDERALRYERAIRAVTGVLGPADADQIEALAPDMPEPLDGPEGRELIDRVAEEVLWPRSGAALAVQRLGEEEIEAELDAGGAIVLGEPVKLDRLLFHALGLAEDDGPVIVRGRTDTGTTVVAVWSAPLLAVEHRRPGRRWGWLYDLPRNLTPGSFDGIDDRRPPLAEEWNGTDPPELAAELLPATSVADPL